MRRWFWRSASPAAVVAEVPTDLPAPGHVLHGRYELVGRIGVGGGAAVYRGVDRLLDLPVAVKVMRPDGFYTSDEARSIDVTLRGEARAAMRLAHPHIVQTYTYDRDGRWEYLVMELVEGENLGRLRRRAPGQRLPVERVMEIGIACLEALGHAHDHGLVHNDVKPSNVLVATDGTVKVCDFGLARPPRREDAGGAVMAGSPETISPERIRGEAGDPRSDLYSLAATLYIVAVGRPPFGRTMEEALHGHLHTPVAIPADLPADFAEVLRRALAKAPEDRFENAAAMRAALERCLERLRTAKPVTSPDADALVAPEDAPTVGTEEEAPTTPISRTAPTIEPPPAFQATPVEPTPLAEQTSAEPVPLAEQPRRLLPPGMAILGGRTVTVEGRSLEVASFALDRTPVTNAAYRRFVVETGRTPPAHWLGDRPPSGKENHPVVGVSLEDARAYARWAGCRLPTVTEWLSAVHGPTGDRSFPWGDVCDHSRCNCARHELRDTTPVDAHPAGATPEGCLDLLGNVWEWVEPDPRLSAVPPDAGVALGGSFRHACARPGEVPRTDLLASKTYLYLGFRCAADLREA